MSLRRYPLIIERTSTGDSAFSPDVPGSAAVGDTEEETRRNFHDDLVAYFEAMREIGEPIPEARSSVDYVEVAAQTHHSGATASPIAPSDGSSPIRPEQASIRIAFTQSGVSGG